jgi:hypothetical protein
MQTLKSEITENAEQSLVRAKVIAKRYDVTERSVFNWFDRGVIPGFRIGKTVRFNLAEVVAKLEGGAR